VTADSQGRIAVPVRDSEAVVANIGWQLGVNVVLPPDPTQTKKSNGANTQSSGAQNAIWASALAITTALILSMAA
jgi:hypothetical protein